MNAMVDERVWGERSFWSRQPLLLNGTFTDGTIAPLSGGTFIGTITLTVPPEQIWFLKKLRVGTQSDANGTSYITAILIDGVNLGTRATIAAIDTLYGDLLSVVTSMQIVGTFGSVGTFLGTFGGGIEGYYTSRYGYSQDGTATF